MERMKSMKGMISLLSTINMINMINTKNMKNTINLKNMTTMTNMISLENLTNIQNMINTIIIKPEIMTLRITKAIKREDIKIITTTTEILTKRVIMIIENTLPHIETRRAMLLL
jgi:hypothetical protein